MAFNLDNLALTMLTSIMMEINNIKAYEGEITRLLNTIRYRDGLTQAQLQNLQSFDQRLLVAQDERHQIEACFDEWEKTYAAAAAARELGPGAVLGLEAYRHVMLERAMGSSRRLMEEVEILLSEVQKERVSVDAHFQQMANPQARKTCVIM